MPGLRERPLTVHGLVHGAVRQVACPGDDVDPGSLEGRPRLAQTVRVVRASETASGEAAVELGVDIKEDVDAVDQEAPVALEDPRRVDVGRRDLDTAHHDAREIAADEAGAGQVGVGEPGVGEHVGTAERRHACSSSHSRDRPPSGLD